MRFNITRQTFISYTLTPQIMPRAFRLFNGTFSHLAFFMALVYRAVNILPLGHPFTLSQNLGKFGLREVISVAASNLKFTRSHLDQVIIFFAILSAMIILFLQFILLFIFMTVGTAMASPPSSWNDILKSPDLEKDLAMRILSHIFGIKELFGTEKGSAAFHTALHALFQFYSVALLVIAALILIYFVFAVLAETAQHGTPFGKRFNHVWAPIRLVVGIGLLVPVTYGLNGAQWITLYAAKFGSNFATNGWIKFNDTLGESWKSTNETDKTNLVATPNTPDTQPLVAFLTIAKTCKVATEDRYQSAGKRREIRGYIVKNNAESEGADFIGKSWEQAADFANRGDIRIRFGEMSRENYTNQRGFVKPWCGELVLLATNKKDPGARIMQEAYYKLVQDIWSSKYDDIANAYYERFGKPKQNDTAGPLVDKAFKAKAFEDAQKPITEAIKKAVEAQVNSDVWKEDDKTLREHGWAGAGVWYNKLAQVNGVMVAAVDALPAPRAMPQVMEDVRKKKKQQNQAIDPDTMYEQTLSGNNAIVLTDPEDSAVARTLNEIYKDWRKDGGLRTDKLASHTSMTGNALIDFINLIFGTTGLFDMCKNADIHPIAQLSNVGKGLVDHSIKMFSASLGLGMGAALVPHIGPALGAMSGFMVTIGMIGLVTGFILFYIVPFLPFLYFFLAVGEWVKGLFEAMVGVPLWALAHLRIDGEGLPGDAAMDGYFLILEVFLRPIMIIFGLLASLTIFAALVKVLNEIFYLAVSNLSGFNPERTGACGKGAGGTGPQVGTMDWFRGPIDEFFFTILYAIIVYMMGMSCFKLIDLIPDNILRWMGTNVNSFGKQAGEQAQGLVQYLTAGGGAMASNLKGSVESLGTAGSKAVQGISGK